jgi:hypothetical protein
MADRKQQRLNDWLAGRSHEIAPFSTDPASGGVPVEGGYQIQLPTVPSHIAAGSPEYNDIMAKAVLRGRTPEQYFSDYGDRIGTHKIIDGTGGAEYDPATGTVTYADVDNAGDPWGKYVGMALAAGVGALALTGAGIGAAAASAPPSGAALTAIDTAAGLVPEFGTHAAYAAGVAPSSVALTAIDTAAGLVPEFGTHAAYAAGIGAAPAELSLEYLNAIDAAGGLVPEYGTHAAYAAGIGTPPLSLPSLPNLGGTIERALTEAGRALQGAATGALRTFVGSTLNASPGQSGMYPVALPAVGGGGLLGIAIVAGLALVAFKVVTKK